MPVMDDATKQPVMVGDTSYMGTFELGDDGFWAAQVVEVPEAISQGRSLEEAQRNLAEVLGLALELRVAEGTEIPQGGRVAVALVTAQR
jgi:predicted RNase H-like HicB family nuclease